MPRSRARWLLAGAVLAAAVSCGYSGPSASALLQRAKATFDQTSAFHIKLTSSDVAGSGTILDSAEGDALRPDSFTGTVGVLEGGFLVQVHVVSTGGTFYALTPFSTKYQVTNPAQYGFGDPGRLLDPESGISTLLTAAQHPSIGGETRLNGESLQQVNATLPGQKVKSLLVDAEPSQPVSVTFDIDTSSNQVREVDLTGPIFEAGHQSTFTLLITNYGESVSVTPPPT
ncbi:MAG TPA: LppX_LprAFG lipoprotein [Candidatus Binatia bacterium]|nr:LppX_LprAFG lipoprotein [Candidatus Binatia bacterium]